MTFLGAAESLLKSSDRRIISYYNRRTTICSDLIIFATRTTICSRPGRDPDDDFCDPDDDFCDPDDDFCDPDDDFCDPDNDFCDPDDDFRDFCDDFCDPDDDFSGTIFPESFLRRFFRDDDFCDPDDDFRRTTICSRGSVAICDDLVRGASQVISTGRRGSFLKDL